MRGHTKFAIVLVVLGTILILIFRSLTATNAGPPADTSDAGKHALEAHDVVATARPLPSRAFT